MSDFFKSGGGSGFILPRLDWNAKEGRAFRVEKVQSVAGDLVTERVEVDNGTIIQIDLANLSAGFLAYGANGLDAHTIRYADMERGATPPTKPSDQHKRGMRFHSVIAGETTARETSTTSQSVISAILDLYNQAKAQGFKDNLAPVIKYGAWKSEEIKLGNGSKVRVYKPQLQLVKMAPRSEYFQKTVAQAEPVRQDAKPSDGLDDEIPF